MTFTNLVTQTFHLVSCYSCGVPFGIEADLYRRAVRDAIGTVYCPACGKQSQWCVSEDHKTIQELRRKLEWEVAEVGRQKAAKDAAQASLRATRGVVTRITRRVSCGVCPCCKRTFKQLANHMKEKHPEFASQPHSGSL